MPDFSCCGGTDERLKRHTMDCSRPSARGHRWDKSVDTIWPLRCAACGAWGRVKPGTAGTMQYRETETSEWITNGRFGCRKPRQETP